MERFDERATTVTTETIGVDSGTVWVGDPGYLVGHLADEHAWSEAVDERHTGPAGERLTDPQVTPLHGGLWFATLWGDGAHQVTIERNPAGRVVRFTVDFTGDANTEEAV